MVIIIINGALPFVIVSDNLIISSKDFVVIDKKLN